MNQNQNSAAPARLITMADWTGSFADIAKPGDLVEERIVDEFMNSVPPRSLERGYLQAGEPYTHEWDANMKKYRGTYPTFHRTRDGWKYCGNCFPHCTEEPPIGGRA